MSLTKNSSHNDLMAKLGYTSKKASPEEARKYRELASQIDGYEIGPNGRKWLNENDDVNYSKIPRYSSYYNYKPNQTPYTKPMSIWDAYNNNVFGRSKIDEGLEEGSDEWNKQNEEVEAAKRNRDYMTIDAISKGLRGIGKDISNAGAAFTGGTMQDSTPETSAWEARNNELIKQGISAEEKNIGGSDAAFNAASKEAEIMGQYKDLSSKELALEMDNMKLIMPREYRKLYENADNIENPILRSAVRGSAATMLNKYINGGEVKAGDIVGSIIANGGNELVEAARRENKTVEQYIADGVKSLVGDLLDAGTNINVNLGANKAAVDPNAPKSLKEAIFGKSEPKKGTSIEKLNKEFGVNFDMITDAESKDVVMNQLREKYPKEFEIAQQISGMTPEELAKAKRNAGDFGYNWTAAGQQFERALKMAEGLGWL